jgi:hypothetical protein
MRSQLMPRKKHEHPTRGRKVHRREGRSRRRSASSDDEENANDTMLEYTSEESESDSEDNRPTILERRKILYKPSKTSWCFCTRRRLKLVHETIRDIILVAIFMLLALSTVKESQLKSIVAAYEHTVNFTRHTSEQILHAGKRRWEGNH